MLANIFSTEKIQHLRKVQSSNSVQSFHIVGFSQQIAPILTYSPHLTVIRVILYRGHIQRLESLCAKEQV